MRAAAWGPNGSLWRRRPRRFWRKAIIGALAMLAAAVGALLAGRVDGLLFYAIVGIVCAGHLIGWFRPLLDLAAESDARDAADEDARLARAAIADSLTPVGRVLSGAIVSPAMFDRQKYVDRTIAKAMSWADDNIGPARTRVLLYLFRSGALHWIDSAGQRSDEPSTKVFHRGTADGDDLFRRLADREESIFFPDVVTEPPPGWDPQRQRAYRPFLAVPILSGSVCLGMLSIDAPLPGDLDPAIDAPILRHAATMIGVAESLRPQSIDHAPIADRTLETTLSAHG